MHNISLVATDLDGTLFYDRGQITARDRAMLYRLREQGILIVFATGRDLDMVTPALDALQLWDAPDYIIHAGGNGLFDMKTKTDRTLAAIAPEILQDVYARHGALDISFLLSKDGKMYTDKPSPILARESQILRHTIEVVDDFPALFTQAYSKIVACGTEEQLANVLPIVTADCDPRYAFHRSHDNYIDCYIRDVTKASALQILCQELALPLANTLAIGDNLNDLQILQAAGYSACPEDGHTDILPLVDYVACPAYEGAVADACDYFIFTPFPSA